MKLESSIFLLFVLTVFSTVTNGIRVKIRKGSFNQTSRVVGGETAEEGFAPYQISLQWTDFQYHTCGGSIIDKDWILTAAHCVFYNVPADLKVVTGTNNWLKPGAIYYIDRIHTHCNFDNPTFHNDIALLHLNSSIIYDEKTQPIPLPSKPMKEGADVVLTGWGSLEAWGTTPEELQKISLKYVPYGKCQEILLNDPDLDIGHICTLTRQGEGACHGDSGGPVVSDGYLVGTVNWVFPCAIGYPDAHASPFYYRDWIRKVMSGNSKC